MACWRPGSQLQQPQQPEISGGGGSGAAAAPAGGGALLGDGGVVEHGHALHAQQQRQAPRDHVVEDDGAEEES